MKPILLTAVAAAVIASLSAASLASAQPYGGGWDQRQGAPAWDQGPGDGTWDLGRRIDWTQQRIDRGRQDGSLDGGEAFRAQSRLDDIRVMVRKSRNRTGGVITPHDRDVLYGRLNQLNDKIHWMRANSDRRPW